jgi:hypothetical protein
MEKNIRLKLEYGDLNDGIDELVSNNELAALIYGQKKHARGNSRFGRAPMSMEEAEHDIRQPINYHKKHHNKDDTQEHYLPPYLLEQLETYIKQDYIAQRVAQTLFLNAQKGHLLVVPDQQESVIPLFDSAPLPIGQLEHTSEFDPNDPQLHLTRHGIYFGELLGSLSSFYKEDRASFYERSIYERIRDEYERFLTILKYMHHLDLSKIQHYEYNPTHPPLVIIPSRIVKDVLGHAGFTLTTESLEALKNEPRIHQSGVELTARNGDWTVTVSMDASDNFCVTSEVPGDHSDDACKEILLRISQKLVSLIENIGKQHIIPMKLEPIHPDSTQQHPYDIKSADQRHRQPTSSPPIIIPFAGQEIHIDSRILSSIETRGDGIIYRFTDDSAHNDSFGLCRGDRFSCLQSSLNEPDGTGIVRGTVLGWADNALWFLTDMPFQQLFELHTVRESAYARMRKTSSYNQAAYPDVDPELVRAAITSQFCADGKYLQLREHDRIIPDGSTTQYPNIDGETIILGTGDNEIATLFETRYGSLRIPSMPEIIRHGDLIQLSDNPNVIAIVVGVHNGEIYVQPVIKDSAGGKIWKHMYNKYCKKKGKNPQHIPDKGCIPLPEHSCKDLVVTVKERFPTGKLQRTRLEAKIYQFGVLEALMKFRLSQPQIVEYISKLPPQFFASHMGKNLSPLIQPFNFNDIVDTALNSHTCPTEHSECITINPPLNSDIERIIRSAHTYVEQHHPTT